jgi:nucleoside-diphosphate-sugar epimerase
MKEILITGGCGFLAKNLILHLLNDQNINKITLFDNFISSNKQDFDQFIKNNNITETETIVTLYQYDITDRDKMNFVKDNFKFDEIYHLASLASPPFYKKYPIETLDVGYLGTKNILEIAKLHGSKVLFSSTSEVYGDPDITPQSETYYGNVNSFGERSCYDISKRVAEALCYTYINQFGLDIKIARIFNTYGPEMMISDGRIVTEVIKSLINNTPLTIYGTGRQTRSLCYITNTINMLVKLMASKCNTPVNIGDNQELTINQIVDTIQQVYITHFDTESKLKKIYIQLTENDPLKRQPCLKKNILILGKEEYISIKDGMFNTISNFLEKA